MTTKARDNSKQESNLPATLATEQSLEVDNSENSFSEQHEEVSKPKDDVELHFRDDVLLLTFAPWRAFWASESRKSRGFGELAARTAMIVLGLPLMLAAFVPWTVLWVTVMAVIILVAVPFLIFKGAATGGGTSLMRR